MKNLKKKNTKKKKTINKASGEICSFKYVRWNELSLNTYKYLFSTQRQYPFPGTISQIRIYE